MIKYIDSHAHYDDDRFDNEYIGGRDQAIIDAKSAGVYAIINSGTNKITTKDSIDLSTKYDFFYATAGIHPSDCQYIEYSMNEALDEISKFFSNPKVVAIGEIGLDYHWDDTKKELQKAYFDAQLSLAEKYKLPVQIHDRDAHGDSMDIVKAHKNVIGVFHSFSGSAEMARQLVNLGWYISFSGPISYKNAGKLHEVAKIVPSDRFLIETDCPYLPPTPHRGEINYSGYLKYTLEALAASREEAPEITAENAFNNTKKLFNIK